MIYAGRILLVLIALSVPLAAVQEVTLRRQLQALEREGNYAAALPLYTELRQLAPQDSSLLYGQVRALAAVGQHEDAVTVLKPWLEQHDEVEAYLALGRAYHALEHNERALKTWRRLLKRHAEDPQLYLQVSQYCRAAGLLDAAIETLEEGRAKLRQDQLFAWDLAELHLQRRDYAQAVRQHVAYLLEDPHRFAQVEYRLQPIAADARQGAILLDALLDLLEKGEPSKLLVRLTAVLALEADQPDRAYKIMMALGAEQPTLVFDFASRAQNLGHHKTAARAYALFAARSPDSPHFYRALLLQAENLTRARKYGQAAALYRDLARRFPHQRETIEALFHLGKLQLEVEGDPAAAQQTLKSIVQAPNSSAWRAEIFILLSECALRLGDFGGAENYIDQLLQRHPRQRQRGRYAGAELHYFQGDFAAALENLNDLLEDDPHGEWGNDALVLVLRLEQHKENVPALEHFAQAQLQQRLGQPDQAARHWDWLLAQGPPALQAQSLLLRAQRHFTAGNLEKALELYQLLVDRYAYEHYTLEAEMGSAALYEYQGDLDQALKTYETALLAHPSDVRVPQIRLHIQRLRAALQERREG